MVKLNSLKTLGEMELFLFFASLMHRFRLEPHPDSGGVAGLPGFGVEDTDPESHLRSPPR